MQCNGERSSSSKIKKFLCNNKQAIIGFPDEYRLSAHFKGTEVNSFASIGLLSVQQRKY